MVELETAKLVQISSDYEELKRFCSQSEVTRTLSKCRKKRYCEIDNQVRPKDLLSQFMSVSRIPPDKLDIRIFYFQEVVRNSNARIIYNTTYEKPKVIYSGVPWLRAMMRM